MQKKKRKKHINWQRIIALIILIGSVASIFVSMLFI